RRIESGTVDARADGKGGDNTAAVGITHCHHAVAAYRKETALRAVDRQSRWFFAWRQRPPFLNRQRACVEGYHLALVLDVHINPPVSVGDRKFGFAPEVGGPRHRPGTWIDNRCRAAAAVKSEDTLRDGLVGDRIGTAASHPDARDRSQRPEIEDGHCGIAAVARVPAPQIPYERDTVDAESIGDVADDGILVEIDDC